MNRTITIIIAVLLIIAGGLYLWGTRTSVPPTITVTAPTGEDTWASGSTHTITWETKGIPSTDKVAVSIRRIPPPPLQEEGQEFDPVVFTGLPNTGSAEWTIADMYPNGTYVLSLQAYASLPAAEQISADSGEFAIVHPTLSEDLSPLYADAAWGTSDVERLTIGTSTYLGASVASTPVTDTTDPGSVFTPFEKYYDKKLKALGWSVANDLAAGGPIGGQTGYRKADGIILTRYHIDYHTVSSTSPSQCPCDVTLSLFSTN